MNRVSCPHCHASLQVDSAFAGKAVKCVRCGGTFIAPDENAYSSETDDGIPILLLVAMLIAGHVVVWLLLGIAIGISRSTLLVILAAGAELVVWQRRRAGAWLQQIRESETAQQLASRCREQLRSAFQPKEPSPDSPVMAQVVDDRGDRLVEVQVGRSPSSRREPIYSRSNGKPLNVDLPRDRVVFLGPGTTFDLGRGLLKDPLVYATNASCGDTFCASLIDATLPVAAPNQPHVDDLPYWPSYYESFPEQRSRYLDWLVGGRCDPNIELGYVFIYFYGLERRVLVDELDHLAIIEEIVRLCNIYSHSNSFRSYSSSLLWLTILLASQEQPVAEWFISKAFHATERWNEDVLGMCLTHV